MSAQISNYNCDEKETKRIPEASTAHPVIYEAKSQIQQQNGSVLVENLKFGHHVLLKWPIEVHVHELHQGGKDGKVYLEPGLVLENCKTHHCSEKTPSEHEVSIVEHGHFLFFLHVFVQTAVLAFKLLIFPLLIVEEELDTYEEREHDQDYKQNVAENIIDYPERSLLI